MSRLEDRGAKIGPIISEPCTRRFSCIGLDRADHVQTTALDQRSLTWLWASLVVRTPTAVVRQPKVIARGRSAVIANYGAIYHKR